MLTYVRPDGPKEIKYVGKASDFSGQLRSDVVYFIDGQIDMGSVSIEVPQGGLYLSGHNFDVSGLYSSEPNYTMFTSPASGSGNLLGDSYSLSVTGAGSQVYDITGDTGNEAFEFDKVNYNNCVSLGEITNYRQGLEIGTGRFGGTPELTMSGSWNGYRITTSIVRGISNMTALFKTGTALTIGGRFVSDINCDLPATGALFDFSASNITNDESMILQGCYITRQGVIDPSDSAIYPNLSHTSVKSNWDSNTGLPNTTKYIKGVTTAEVATTVALINTYYPLLGTITLEKNVQFDMPANGEYRLLTGNGTYQISGDIAIEGTANDVIDLRVTLSGDGGSTWPTEVNHIRRVINNLAGGRDVAFFPISFIQDIKKDERLRIEVENKTAARNVTMELDSYFIVTEI